MSLVPWPFSAHSHIALTQWPPSLESLCLLPMFSYEDSCIGHSPLESIVPGQSRGLVPIVTIELAHIVMPCQPGSSMQTLHASRTFWNICSYPIGYCCSLHFHQVSGSYWLRPFKALWGECSLSRKSGQQGLLCPPYFGFLWLDPAISSGYEVLATLGCSCGFGEGQDRGKLGQ